MDKSAFGFEDSKNDKIGTNYSRTKPDVFGAKPVGTFLSRFENCDLHDKETKQKVAEQKGMREKKDNDDKDAAIAQVGTGSKYYLQYQDSLVTNFIHTMGLILIWIFMALSKSDRYVKRRHEYSTIIDVQHYTYPLSVTKRFMIHIMEN
jgi:hypothetical protein